jgi:hypothetical protein
MAKYKLINWQTLPFKRKSFDGQLERYIKCCVVSADVPDKVLDVVYIFGNRWLTDHVHKRETDNANDSHMKDLAMPVDGEFVEVKSLHGSLYRVFSKDEAQYGLCSAEDVGKAERDNNGKVKIYHTIKVFTLYKIIEIIGQKEYLNGWYPSQMYYRYFGYRYHPLSDLTEPLQL